MNLKCRVRKTSRPSDQLSKIKEPELGVWGRDSLALYLVMWLEMCVFKIAFFEVDASLKWMPQQSMLKSGTSITKRKKKQLFRVYATVFL